MRGDESASQMGQDEKKEQHSVDWRTGRNSSKTEAIYGGYVGELATMADGELHAMNLALGTEDSEMLALLSDSQAAIQSIVNMSRGAPLRLGIEVQIKSALTENVTRDIKVAWVRGHIGITGNEKADKRAALESILGNIRGTARIVTEGGVRTASRAIRKLARTRSGFGLRCVTDLGIGIHLDADRSRPPEELVTPYRQGREPGVPMWTPNRKRTSHHLRLPPFQTRESEPTAGQEQLGGSG